MRRLALNLLTGSVTVLLLAGLALPAKHVLDAPPKPLLPDADPPGLKRAFGVYVDPWHLDDWVRNVGATPQMIAKFQAFSQTRSLAEFIRESERQGVKRLLLSWEPWKPVPTSLGIVAQFRPQLGYRNADIASGWQDGYIGRIARSLAGFDGTVYVRYAHEMNGVWYPWSQDQVGYRRAWRRVVGLFRRAGADNVRFVWSVNPSLYVPRRTWLRQLRGYWPGQRYVDVVGSTMINFGGRKDYSIGRFIPRLSALRRLYGKPMMISEANTEYRHRMRWLHDFRNMLNARPWITSVGWSQLPSRGKAHLEGVGALDWDVQQDPPAAGALREIIRDGLKSA